MLKLWINTLAKNFFAQHTGMFLFIFYLIFGAVEPGQLVSYHFALLSAINSSIIITLIFCFLLLLYALKCLAFVRLQLAAAQYNFIKESGSASLKEQQRNWLGLYIVLMSPILLYTIMVLSVGFYQLQFINTGILIIFCGLLLWGLVKLTVRHINYAFEPPLKLFNYQLPVVKKPFYTWRFYYLIKEQTIMLIVCKVLSLFLFKAIVWMFGATDDPFKVYAIAMLAAVLSHSILVATLLRFERTQLSFEKSLPISYWKKLSGLLLFFVFLFIPELLIFSKLSSYSLPAILAGISFCIGCLSTFYLSLYFFGDDMERYYKFIFFFFIGMMLVILYNIVLVAGIVLIIISSACHLHLFYTSKL